ncbi:MAG: hypothetical protein ABIH23_00915 [bacterium]
MAEGNSPSSSSLQVFLDHVHEFSSVCRRRILVYWSLVILIYGLLSSVLLLVTGVLTHFSFAGMNIAAAVVLMGACWILWGIVRSILLGRLGVRRLLQRCEREHPDTFDRLLTAQDLATRPEDLDRLGYSRELIDRTVEYADDYVQRLVTRELTRAPVEPPLAIVGGLVLFGTVLTLVLPGGSEAGKAFFASVGSWWREEAPVFSGSPYLIGPERVVRGAPADLSITILNPLDEAVLHIEQRGNWRKIPLELQSDGHTVYTIPEVNETLTCLVTASNLASKRLTIRPVDPPVVAEVAWRIVPPAYTRLPERKTAAGLAEIVVPVGSDVDVTVRADQPLAAAEWLLGDRRIPLDATGELACGTAHILGASPFAFEMRNDLGMVSRSATESISIIADRPPKASIVAPEQTAMVDQSEHQEISALVMDDYGVQRVLLCYEFNYQEAQRATIELQQTADTVNCPTQTTIQYDWDLSPFRLIPGDEISYYIEAWDNDPFANSKSGRSTTHILRSPSLADVYQNMFADEVEQVETMTAITEKQHSITEEVHDIAESVLEKVAEDKAEEGQENSLFAEQRRLEELKERQEDLHNELAALQEEIGKISESENPEIEEEAGLSLETLAKIERIQELMSQLMTREGKELLQQVEKVIEEMSQELDPKDLEAMEFSFEKYEQELDRTLSQLEGAYQMRQLEGLWRVAQEMAERQERLERDTEELEKNLQESGQDAKQLEQDQGALEQRQEALNQDAEAMVRAMERLAQTVSPDNPQLGEKLEQMVDTAQREMSGSMQEAQQLLAQQDLSKAQDAMNKAQQQLQRMAEDLQEQFASLGGISMQMDLQRISRLVDRGLFLSDQQERLVDSPLASRQARRSLELEVLYSQEALRIGKEWEEILATNPFADVSVIAFLEAAAGGMRKAIAISESEEWIPYGPAHAALRNVNDAVAAMLKSMDSLMQQAAGQSGGEGFFQELQRLIEQQKRLNEETDRLQGQQPGERDMLSQLQQMAQQQARIRKEMQELMRQYRHMKNLQSRLDEVAKQMEEVEQQLRESRLDRELDEKQDRILTRMLEAQTSQEQDTYGRRRKAEQPDGDEGVSSPSDTVDTGNEQEFRDVYEAPGSQFVPYRYRDLVKRYFRNLRQRESL